MMTFRRPRSNPQASMLGLRTNGEPTGSWSIIDSKHRFQCTDSWLASSAARPFSLSLPFAPGNMQHRGEVVRNFFDNLLPDSDAIRRRIRDKFSTGSTQTFDLLDVLSAWPIIGNRATLVSPRRARLAMALRGKNTHYYLHEISTRHWEVLARSCREAQGSSLCAVHRRCPGFCPV